jgi:hypothetical protein
VECAGSARVVQGAPARRSFRSVRVIPYHLGRHARVRVAGLRA